MNKEFQLYVFDFSGATDFIDATQSTNNFPPIMPDYPGAVNKLNGKAAEIAQDCSSGYSILRRQHHH
jgi:hypothetical protein